MTATLLAIPNVSEGRDVAAIDAIGAAFDARLLGIHSDPDHHRSVFTLAGQPGRLAGAVLRPLLASFLRAVGFACALRAGDFFRAAVLAAAREVGFFAFFLAIGALPFLSESRG